MIDDSDKGFLFVSRLLRTDNECHCAIEQAIEADRRQEIGVISNEAETENRKPSFYRCFETVVALYGITCRALVVHSDAYDERRQKQVDKQIAKEREELARLKKRLEKIDYACLPDAEGAAERISAARFHEITISIQPKPHIGADQERMERTMRLNLRATRSTITVWKKRQTSTPTSLMLTTTFAAVCILVTTLHRRLSQPLNEVQLKYLKIFELNQEAFLNPSGLQSHLSRRE